jgi:hypothetical protein
MKYVYIVIPVLLIQISFAQTGVNERDVQNFKNKSPFKGKLSKTEVPLDYSLDEKSKPSTDTLEDNPFSETLDSWEKVHYKDSNTAPSQLYTSSQSDYIDWQGIIITISVIFLVLVAGIFLYKLLK